MGRIFTVYGPHAAVVSLAHAPRLDAEHRATRKANRTSTEHCEHVQAASWLR